MNSKILFPKFKNFFEKLPRILAERAFLVCLFLFLLALALGAFLFYKYNFLVKKTGPEIIKSEFRFEENKYQGILKIWQEKEEKLNETSTSQYLDPFFP